MTETTQTPNSAAWRYRAAELRHAAEDADREGMRHVAAQYRTEASNMETVADRIEHRESANDANAN